VTVTRRTAILGSVGAFLGAGGLAALWPRPPSADSVRARLAEPVPAPTGAMNVYHLGHSLVNRDMPAMLAQIAPPGHRYDSQLGWGTPLKAHWGDAPISGFAEENAHPHFRPAHEAIASGAYDAIVLTEMVEIRDSIQYFDSAAYLARWAEKALSARPDVRLYLYETWHRLDDPEGWLQRIDQDHERYWLRRVLGPALDRLPPTARIHLIPAGPVLAALTRKVEARGGVGPMRDRRDLFARTPGGQVDPIHLGDLGNILVALVHRAVLYHALPSSLPDTFHRADGSEVAALSPELADLMLETTTSVVHTLGLSGVSA
jgi:hypothetical protein